MVFNASWHISNKTLCEDSGIPFVEDEINRLTNSYLHDLPGHPDEQVSHLHVPPSGQEAAAPTLANRCVRLNGTTS